MLNFFNFNGRVNRLIYAIYFLVGGFLSSITGIVLENTNNTSLGIISAFIYAIIGIKLVLISIQRFHDIEKSGKNVWWLCLPIINIYFVIVLLFKKGTNEPNKFGENPLQIVKK